MVVELMIHDTTAVFLQSLFCWRMPAGGGAARQHWTAQELQAALQAAKAASSSKPARSKAVGAYELSRYCGHLTDPHAGTSRRPCCGPCRPFRGAHAWVRWSGCSSCRVSGFDICRSYTGMVLCILSSTTVYIPRLGELKSYCT